jgi:C-terminal processing protease CtpA/Prc
LHHSNETTTQEQAWVETTIFLLNLFNSSNNYYNALPEQVSAMNMGYSYQNRNAVMTSDYQRSRSPGRELDMGNNGYLPQQQQQAVYDNYYSQHDPQTMYGYGDYSGGQNYGMLPSPANYGGYHPHNGYSEELGYGYTQGYSPSQYQRSSSGSLPRGSSMASGRKESTSFEHSEPLPGNLTRWPRSERRGQPAEYLEMTVTLHRQDTGFGFRIVGGTEEGSQVSIGHIVPGGAADLDGRLFSGDEIVAVDNIPVMNTSHHQVVGLMGQSAQNGRVTLSIRRRIFQSEGYSRATTETYPYDVTVTRRENEGFGFVIISSVSRAGSTIGRIIAGSPAERCGRLHIGDRILAVNHVDINNMHHGEIVNLIKDSGYSVVLTVGPPIDDASSTASTSQREDQELNMLEMDDQYYAVELGRGARGFGFSIRGGREFQSMPLFVLRIAVDGPAAADGRLRVGDQIIEINGNNTKNMTHAEAIELIKSGGNVVRLLVRRGKMPPSALIDQMAMSPLSPTPMPTSSSVMGRPMSAMSQPTSATASGNQGYLPTHLPPGALPLPGLALSGSSYTSSQQPTAASYTTNGYLNGPVSQSSPRMISNAEGYYYNQY